MKNLLLLHGAMGSAREFDQLKELMSAEYNVFTLDFSGHGEMPLAGRFSIAQFADEVIEFLDKRKLTSVSIFGYSMGGYAALYLALHFPERISAVVTLASKLHWTEEIAAKETAMLDPEKIVAKVPKYAEALQQKHRATDWKELMLATADMMRHLGKDNVLKAEEYQHIRQPVLLLLGDRDKMVTAEETFAAYKNLPSGQLGILPGTPHPFDHVNKTLLLNIISTFLHTADAKRIS